MTADACEIRRGLVAVTSGENKTAWFRARRLMPLVKNAESLPSREFGLAIGLILGRFFVKMEDLHYGYWTDDIPIEMPNLPKAQAQYSNFLMSHIPEGVKSILDVGCGAGNTARKLLDRGYQVDCVSPNSFLTSVAQETLGNRTTFFKCRFEDLQTDRRYDLLFFSESFLFMRLDEAIAIALQLLRPGGYILMSDIFKIVPDGNTAIGGGQHLTLFYDAFARTPFAKLKEIDMTPQIAPTFTLVNDAYFQAVKPAYDLVMGRLRAKHPWLMKVILWKFRNKIHRAESKHFSGKRTAETFSKIKSYRLFLFQKQVTAPLSA
jgi:SAM-dependent methyltransferase